VRDVRGLYFFVASMDFLKLEYHRRTKQRPASRYSSITIIIVNCMDEFSSVFLSIHTSAIGSIFGHVVPQNSGVRG
jgi:hypothetical protein